MKIKSTVISLAIIITACHSPRTNRDIKLVQVKTDSIKNEEYIDWDSIKINAHIPMISHFKDVVKLLGKPDSVTTPNYDEVSESYNNEKFKYCYLKGVQFEKYNDTLVFRVIDFRRSGKWFLSYKQMRFDCETTMNEFEKLFPISAKENGLHGTDMDKSLSISLRTAKPGNSISDNWVFTFESSHNKLIRLEYWIDD